MESNPPSAPTHHTLHNTSSQESHDGEKAGRARSNMSHSGDDQDHDETATAVHEKVDPAEMNPVAVSPGAATNKPRRFAHGFFDAELAGMRKASIKIMVMYTILIILAMWSTLIAFWGSFYHAADRSNRLSIAVFDFDTPSSLGASTGLATNVPTLGQYIVQACLANANGSTTDGHTRGTLGFWEADASKYPDMASIENAIVQEEFWAAVVIPRQTTSNLLQARQNGDTAWQPQDTVLYVYNQARNENAAGSYIVPIGQAVLTRATAAWAARSAGQYLSTTAGNQTAIQALVAAPQTISPGVSFRLNNLRSFAVAPTATAATLVGGIFTIVFAFLLTMAFSAVRGIIGPFLTLKQYIAMRLVIPTICYVFVSLSIAMLNLPYKVPFDAHFSYGTGFFVWWMACLCAMMACGLALEFWMTILGPRFTAFAMLFIIIYQVSTVSLPHELQISFFHYGIGVPLNRTANILRTLIFDTKSELGLGFGVLLAWWALSAFITLPLITWVYRRKDLKAYRKEQEGASSPAV